VIQQAHLSLWGFQQKLPNQTTKCSTVILQKTLLSQLVNKFPAVLRNLNVHYRVHTSPTFVRILGQLNPVNAILSVLSPTLFIPSLLRQGLPRCLLHSGFPTKTLYAPLIPHVPHVQPISFFSIALPKKCLVRSTDHEAPHSAAFSIIPSFAPS